MPSDLPRLTVRLSQETIDKIKTIAKREHRSTNEHISYLIEKHIEEYEAKQERAEHKNSLKESSNSKIG